MTLPGAIMRITTTFGARSNHHALTIEPQALPSGETAYDILVTDRDTNAVLLNAHPHATRSTR